MRTERSIPAVNIQRTRHADPVWQHAFNYALSTTTLAAVVGVIVWAALWMMGKVSVLSVGLVFVLAVLLGLAVGARKLMQYTDEWHAEEPAFDEDDEDEIYPPEPTNTVRPVPWNRAHNPVMVHCPNGRAVSEDFLFDLVRNGRVVGLSAETWVNIRKHKRRDWEGALQLLAELGIITMPRRGQSTEFLLDQRTALERLSYAIRG